MAASSNSIGTNRGHGEGEQCQAYSPIKHLHLIQTRSGRGSGYCFGISARRSTLACCCASPRPIAWRLRPVAATCRVAGGAFGPEHALSTTTRDFACGALERVGYTEIENVSSLG